MHALLSAGWRVEPGVALPLLGAALWYAAGLRRLAHRGAAVRRAEWMAAVGTVITIAVALASPLDALADRVFVAHMVQHELLLVVAAPLAAASRAEQVLAAVLPDARIVRWARGRLASVWRAATRPLHAFLIQLALVWGWHTPALFDAAVASDPIHALEHLSFVGGALLFWWSVLRAPTDAARGAAIVYLFLTAVGTGVLGALMTFARAPWYAAYAAQSPLVGFAPLADQQLGGLVMWIPASVPYLVAALLAARRLLADPVGAAS